MKKILLFSIPLTLIVCGILFIQSPELKENKKPVLRTGDFEEIPKKDRPDLAAAFEEERTKDPALGYAPTGRLVDAFEFTKRKLSNKNQKAIPGVEWTERGPYKVGGRTRAIMWDPNDPAGKKVWAGGVGGGMWYNTDITDANNEWVNVDDFMANLSIADFTYDPNNTQTFYVGTGMSYTGRIRGAGIWKSTDGGTNWDRLASTDNENFEFVSRMVVTSTSKVLAGTTEGLYVSTDGGTIWTRILSDEIAEIKIASNGDIYLGTFNGRIYKSTNDGVDWTNLTIPTGAARVEMALAPSDDQTAYALANLSSDSRTVAWLIKTTDGGDTWTELTIPKYIDPDENGVCQEDPENDFTRGQAFFDLTMAVHPTNASEVYMGGIDLYKTTDAGTSWTNISHWYGYCEQYVHADQHIIRFKPGSTTEAIFGNDGGVFYSSDMDNAGIPEITVRNNNYNVTQFYATSMDNRVDEDYYLAGAQDNGSQQFSKPGMSNTKEVTGGDGAFTVINQDDPNIQLTSYVYNNYYISRDGGNTFLAYRIANTGKFINPMAYDKDTDVLYTSFGVNKIGIVRNIKGAIADEQPTIELENRDITHVAISPHTYDRIFIGTVGGVYRIDNASTTSPTSTRIDTGNIPNYVSCIAIGESDDDLFVTMSNYGVVSMFQTKNGGSTWTNKEGDLPDMPVRWAIYNPLDNNQVMIATELGVWTCDDIAQASPVWEPSVEGLANVRCEMLKVRSSDNQVAVATFGRGLFTSNVFRVGKKLRFDADKTLAYEGTDVTFTNKTVGGTTNYLWNFGDNQVSTETSPVHSYEHAGNYTVAMAMDDQDTSLIKENYIKILETKQGSYSLAQGGDLESNQQDFYAHNVKGTPLELGNSTISGKDGTASGDNAWVLGLTAENYIDNTEAYLYSPKYELTNLEDFTLKFKSKYVFEATWDGFIVEYTLDDGNTWTKLGADEEANWYNSTSDPQSVFGDGVGIFSGTTTGTFEEYFYALSNIGTGAANIGFRFVVLSDSFTTDVGSAFDDIELEGPAEAISVAIGNNVANSTCTNSVVTFTNNSTGSDIQTFAWDFGADALPATAQGAGPHEVRYNTSGSKTVVLTVNGTATGNTSMTITDFVGGSITPTYDNSTCYSEDISVGISGSDTDLFYRLINTDNGNVLTDYIKGTGNTIYLVSSEKMDQFNLRVESTDFMGGCATTSDDFSIVTSSPLPTETTLTKDVLCSGESLQASIAASQAGVNYTFYDAGTSQAIGSTVEGVDGVLVLTSAAVETDVESIYVYAENINNGCALKILETNITVNPNPNPSIDYDLSGRYLVASESISGPAYQWYVDGEALPGATQARILPLWIGSYTVKVTAGSCETVSEPFEILVLSSEEASDGLTLYPNPVVNELTIKGLRGKGTISFFNIDGKSKAQTLSFNNNSLVEKGVDVSLLKPGIYFAVIETKESKSILKFIKQ